MTFEIIAMLLGFVSSLAFVWVVARRLEREGRSTWGVFSPIVVFRLRAKEYAMIFGIMALDLLIVVLLYRCGVIIE